MSTSNRVTSTDQLKKIAGKLSQLGTLVPSGAPVEELNLQRELWELWEMFRILTLRIRDLEQESTPRAVARKINTLGRESARPQPPPPEDYT